MHLPGSPLAEELWTELRKEEVSSWGGTRFSNGILDDLDAVFGYLSHRDLLSWLRPNGESKVDVVLDVIRRHRPEAVVIVSTKSAVKAQKGFPFLQLLLKLAEYGFQSHWFTASAKAFGLPHDAHYTILLSLRGGGARECARSIAPTVATSLGDGYSNLGAIESQLETRRPRLGAARRSFDPLPSAGLLSGGTLTGTTNRYFPKLGTSEITLQRIVCSRGSLIKPRPVRLVSRYGDAGCAFKDDNSSYALGPGTSAYPLFAFDQRDLRGRDVFDCAPFSNWSTTRNGFVIVRLEPSRAILLHGVQAWRWQRHLKRSRSSFGSQYALISAGVPPTMLRQVVDRLSLFLRGAH